MRIKLVSLRFLTQSIPHKQFICIHFRFRDSKKPLTFA